MRSVNAKIHTLLYLFAVFLFVYENYLAFWYMKCYNHDHTGGAAYAQRYFFCFSK